MHKTTFFLLRSGVRAVVRWQKHRRLDSAQNASFPGTTPEQSVAFVSSRRPVNRSDEDDK
jgi:hypothetical protein